MLSAQAFTHSSFPSIALQKTLQFMFYITMFSALEEFTIFKGQREPFTQQERKTAQLSIPSLSPNGQSSPSSLGSVPPEADLQDGPYQLPCGKASSEFSNGKNQREEEEWDGFLPVLWLVSRSWLVGYVSTNIPHQVAKELSLQIL